MPSVKKPVIGVPASILQVGENQISANTSGKRIIDSLVTFAHCIPLIIPAREDATDTSSLLDNFDGIFLSGGRANVEPHHYGASPFPSDEITDTDRDNTVLPLIRECIERRMPLFGVCRGIQEMNIAMGGTLYYRVNEIPGKNDHRMPRGDDVTQEEVFQLRHTVKLKTDGLFQQLAQTDQVKVNSLHGQAIDRLADAYSVEATTVEDNVIEGIRLKNDPTFTVGVQWHAEWKPEESEHFLSRKLYEEFGNAARKYFNFKS